MQAMELLRSVAQAYANLKSLAVEIRSAAESADDDCSNRSETRAKAWFEAPNKVRIEEGGTRGSLLVDDGIHAYSLQRQRKQYWKQPRWEKHALGAFDPEYNYLGGSPPRFLFSKIAERVSKTRIVAEEAGCIRVSVEYETSREPQIFWLSSPIEFSVDPHTNLVTKMEGEMTHRPPAEDETEVKRHSIQLTNKSIDAPLPPETFEFTPPADAVDASQQQGACGSRPRGGGRIGHGRASTRSDGKGAYEMQTSHEWSGGALIEREKLRTNGIDVTLERSLTFSEDGRELTVSERIVTPAGETVHEFTAPLRGKQ